MARGLRCTRERRGKRVTPFITDHGAKAGTAASAMASPQATGWTAEHASGYASSCGHK